MVREVIIPAALRRCLCLVCASVSAQIPSQSPEAAQKLMKRSFHPSNQSRWEVLLAQILRDHNKSTIVLIFLMRQTLRKGSLWLCFHQINHDWRSSNNGSGVWMSSKATNRNSKLREVDIGRLVRHKSHPLLLLHVANHTPVTAVIVLLSSPQIHPHISIPDVAEVGVQEERKTAELVLLKRLCLCPRLDLHLNALPSSPLPRRTLWRLKKTVRFKRAREISAVCILGTIPSQLCDESN